jgi:hypothetical protein
LDGHTSKNDGNRNHFPKPDRSDQRPNSVKTADNDVIDIGWDEGVFRDGRPYRVEAWCQDQVTSLTFFWSISDMPMATKEDLAKILVDEGLLRFTSEKHFVYGRQFVDPSRRRMWSVNVVVGDDEETYVRDSCRLKSYNV